MGTQMGQSTSTQGGWLTQVRHLPMNLLLATARAAGRATRVSQGSASTVAKGVIQVATWSKEGVAGSAKWLNTLRRTKRSSNKPPADKPVRPAATTPPAPKLAPPLLKHTPVASPAPSARPEPVCPIQTPKSDQVKPHRRSRPAPPPRPRIAGTAADAVPPEVTVAETSAAVFATASDKVTFTRSLAQLASQEAAARARAAGALGTIAHELSVRALAARLGRDPAATVRKECVNALAALGKSAGLPAVERALADPSSIVRLAAVRAVYRLAGDAGISALVRMLSDREEGVRRRAAVCIGWLGRPEFADPLRPLLREGSAWVRLAALEALQCLKSPAAADDVIVLLDDSDESVRRQAVETLRTITGKQIAATLPKDERARQLLIARWRAWRGAGCARPPSTSR